jgi:hypothetical protein
MYLFNEILTYMRKIIFPIVAVSVFLSSCTTEDTLFDGPSLIDIYGEFAILDSLKISTTEVDFSTSQTVSFSAEFSKNVNWKIEITGDASGAVYVIEGFSRLIDETNSVWNGSASTLPMFRVEQCSVALTILNESDTLSGSVEIIGTKTLNGFILSDFEDELNPGWLPFVQSGADMSFFITDETIAAQGSKYYDMGGEVNWDWLIGLVDIPATAYGAATFPLSSNPADVYFNVMLSKIPSLSNAIVLFQFKEDDDGDGIYTAASEDIFSFEVKLTANDGWQLYSIKYADLPTLINGAPTDPLGNGIYEPEKLHMISVLMLANPTSGYAQAFMDLMVFTENEPFKP